MAKGQIFALVVLAALNYVAGQCTFPAGLEGNTFTFGFDKNVQESILMKFQGSDLIRMEYKSTIMPPTEVGKFECTSLKEDGDDVFFVSKGGPDGAACHRMSKGSEDTYFERMTNAPADDTTAEQCVAILANAELDGVFFIKHPASPTGVECPAAGGYKLVYELRPGAIECEDAPDSTLVVSGSEMKFNSCMTDAPSFKKPLKNNLICKSLLSESVFGKSGAGDLVLLADLTLSNRAQYFCARYKLEGGEVKMSLDVQKDNAQGCKLDQTFESVKDKEFLAIVGDRTCHPPCTAEQVCNVENVCIGNPCLPTNPCKNEGVCQEDAPNYTCECVDGWQGDTCEEDRCDPNPCENSGECVRSSDEDSGFKCECADGWVGQTCTSDDPCLPNPCDHSGLCQVSSANVSYFQCQCSGGWQGATCGDDPCDPSPCQNNGTCSMSDDADGGYKCDCVDGWGGKDCDDDDQGLDETLLIVLLIALFLVVLAIIFLICFFCVRRRREEKKVREFEKTQTGDSTGTMSTVLTEKNAYKADQDGYEQPSMVWNSDQQNGTGSLNSQDRGVITMNRGDTIVATF